jgi:ferric-dicitrate binding protein FerR (iron transport regulator)
LAWKTGKMVFNQTPLLTVASVLSNYYDIQIIIEGDIKYCEFSSIYENKDISIILKDIEQNYNPRIIQNMHGIIIRGNLCN